LSFYTLAGTETLSITNPTQTTVTLNGEGLISNMNLSVVFNLKNRYSSTPAYSKSQQVLIDSTGIAASDFSGLSPGGEYEGTMSYVGGSAILGTVHFYTVAGITLSVQDPKSTSVTLKAENLTPNTAVTLTVKNKDSATPTYNNLEPATTDGDGTAISYFSSMSPGGYYIGTVNYVGKTEILGTANFSTFASDVVPPATTKTDFSTKSGDWIVPGCPAEGCGFTEFIKLIMNFVNFILFKLAIPIAAIMFAYAGFLLVTSGGETSKRTKAKSIFLNVALGLIFAAAAWLIIHTIGNILGYDASWIGL
jgi:hypothetical protein